MDRRRWRGVPRRQRAEQVVRRAGRGQTPYAVAGGRGSACADRQQGRRGDRRRAPLRRIPDHEHSHGDQRAGRRTGAARARAGARSEHACDRQLRRPHAQHHRHPVAGQRRHSQSGGGAAQRHHRLDAGGPAARPRRQPPRTCHGRRRQPRQRPPRRARDRRPRRRAPHCAGGVAIAAGARPHRVPLRRAHARGIRRWPPPGLRQCAGRAAGAGDRPQRPGARRAHRAGR
ncbi:hypothetical protein D3C72_1530160 [compost metagenome]